MKTKRAMRKNHKRGDARRKWQTLRPRTPEDFFALPEEAQTDWKDTLRVISKMRSDGLSLKRAAKQESVNARTVTQWWIRALKKRSNGSYTVSKTDKLFRSMKILDPQGVAEFFPRSSQEASTVGRYWNAVEKARRGDYSDLRKFKRRFVRDRDGNKHSFITEPDELHRLGSAGVLSFEQIYGK